VDSKEILERLLKLSRLQTGFFEHRRYPELLKAQAERVELFKELDKIKDGEVGKERLIELRDKVLESDKELAIRFNSEMDSLRGKLKKVAKGSTALKAYSGRINK